MNILVTGGSGFIGSNLISLLLNKKNVKRVIKLEARTEEEAIEKALKREERRKTRNCYEFVDCDYNIVEKKEYEAYRQNNQEVRRGSS